MADPFIGEVKLWSFDFAPRFWAKCDGQLLLIQQNAALFSLLGTTFGGNGTTNFGLPDLRGKVGIHRGQGPGLTNRSLGQPGGVASVTLTQSQLPAHSHGAASAPVSTQPATHTDPAGRVFAVPTDGSFAYATQADATLGGVGATTPVAGGSQPHSNMQPYLTLNFCIALQGIFPSRS